MSSRAPNPPFWPRSKRLALAAVTLAGILVLASAPAQISSALPQASPGQAQAGERLEFKTDECGDLSAIESSRPILSESSTTDDSDGDGEDESMSAWGMSDEDRAVSKQWMLQHPT